MRHHKLHTQSNAGITLFIAVVVMSILLFIGFAVSNIAIKSSLFVTSGRASQEAFYAADAGVECALYWDSRVDPSKFDPTIPGGSITCGGMTLTGDTNTATYDPITGTSTLTLIGGGVGGGSNIAFVSRATNSDYNASPTNTISTPAFSATAGNLIVVALRYQGTGGPTVTSVTDTSANTYQYATGVTYASGSREDPIQIWYAKNIVANPSNIVTFTLSGPASHKAIHAIQYSGADTAAPLDKTATGFVTSGSTVTSSSFTTTSAKELVIALSQVRIFNSTWTPTIGYTSEIIDPSPYSVTFVQDKIVSTVQSNVNVSVANSDTSAQKSVAVATFKAGNVSSTGTNRTSTFGFSFNVGSNPSPACAVVTVNKDVSGTTYIKSRGYNTCDTTNPRRIERGIEVQY